MPLPGFIEHPTFIYKYFPLPLIGGLRFYFSSVMSSLQHGYVRPGYSFVIIYEKDLINVLKTGCDKNVMPSS